MAPSDVGPANAGPSSQIFGNGLELVDDGHRGFPGSVRRDIEAMVNVIVDQRALGLSNGFLDGMKLLGEIEARTFFIEHLNDAAKMAFGALQSLDDIRMGFVNVIVCHGESVSPRGG